MQPCRFRSSGKATADVKGVYLRQQMLRAYSDWALKLAVTPASPAALGDSSEINVAEHLF